MARLAAFIAALTGLWVFAAGAATPIDLVAPANFDFYVLTLSWSPQFCDSSGADRSPEQCRVGASSGFVVHGLWPDNANREDPSDCRLQPEYVPGGVLGLGAQVYPSRGLAIHEWKSHGTCTGLDAAHYFRAVQYARNEFKIPEAFARPRTRFSASPDEIIKQFAAANANLTADSMAVTCAHGELVDVRFCLTRNLGAFALCPKVVRRSCHAGSLNVAPVR